MNATSHRLSRQEESEIACRILQLEAELAARLDLGRASGRTRAGWVAQLERAVRAAGGEGADDVKRQWASVQALHWRLALSASFLLAREAHRLAGNPSLTQEELVQEGWIGLQEAARRYQPERGFRFYTYARWWVQATMVHAIEVGKLVRLPASAVREQRRLHRSLQSEAARGGSSLAELADSVGISPQRATQLLEAGTLQWLDAPTDEEGRTLELEDGGLPSDEQVELNRARVRVRAAMSSVLTDRQRAVIEQRYGLEAPTYRELGRRMFLSHQGVRLIEAESLQALRHACFGPDLERSGGRACA
jgi:RNA polymerase primary sigma factor